MQAAGRSPPPLLLCRRKDCRQSLGSRSSLSLSAVLRGDLSLYSPPHGEQLPRPAPRRAADRRRRRHGDARLGGRAAPALPRGGEHPRAGRGRLRPPELHQRRRRADRDEHLRREPAEARRALPRGRAGPRSTRPGSSSPATRARSRAGRCSSPGRSGRSASTRRPGPRSARPLFAEQAELLAGRGVDLFSVETFFDLDELVTAIEAVRSVSSLPIVAMMTFGEDAETIGGVTAAEAADAPAPSSAWRRSGRTTAPARTPRSRRSRRWARRCRSRRCRTSASRACPAAGSSTRTPTPEYFAEFAAHARTLGAKVIGGCCGTTPTEIAAIRSAVDEERAPRAPLGVRRARAGRRGRARRDGDEARRRPPRRAAW